MSSAISHGAFLREASFVYWRFIYCPLVAWTAAYAQHVYPSYPYEVVECRSIRALRRVLVRSASSDCRGSPLLRETILHESQRSAKQTHCHENANSSLIALRFLRRGVTSAVAITLGTATTPQDPEEFAVVHLQNVLIPFRCVSCSHPRLCLLRRWPGLTSSVVARLKP